jgi:hypothetical protein
MCKYNFVNLFVNPFLDLDGLTKHNNGVTFHDGNTSETFADLERVDNEWLLRLEHALSHFSGLNGCRALGLLATGLLTDLPDDFSHLDGGTSSSDEGNWAVTRLQLTRVVEDLDVGCERLGSVDGVISLDDHDIANTRHVVLWQGLDVHTDVVTLAGLWDLLVVHFDSEDLSSARSGCRVGWQEKDFITRLDGTLFDTASEDITDTLDLVDSRQWDSHLSGGVTLWWLDEFLQAVKKGTDSDGVLSVQGLDLNTFPPAHLFRLLDEVISLPARDWEDWALGGNEVFLPADLGKHVAHFVTDFCVTSLAVLGNVAIHLVDSDKELLDSEQVDEDGVLTGLSLDFTGLRVTLGNGGGEVTIGWDHQKSDIGLGGTSDHVLDEITMTWGINDGVMVGFSEEFLGGASNGDTTLTFLLLAIHIESKSEGALSDLVSLSLQFLDFTLGDSSELEDETSSGGGLAGIDMPADDN